MNSNLNYEKGDRIEFKIDYQKEIVKFNGLVLGVNSMYLKEFANNVLKVRTDSKELLALFIGKEISESYHKKHNYYILEPIKTKKNIFVGTIQKVLQKAI